MIWHSSNSQDVLNHFEVDSKIGLSNSDADNKLEIYGKNIVSDIKVPTFLQRFIEQLKNKTVIALLIIAFVSMGVSFAYPDTGSYSALLILAIVVVNALISAYHIYSCNRSITKIKDFSNPTTTVLREGILKTVNASELVVGDIIILEEGDYIPADARLIEVNEFRCNETLISGDEVPVDKNADLVFEDITPVAERLNMVFSGSSVAHGSAKAVVVATGLNTEIGKSSSLLQQTGEDKLPLESQMLALSKIVNTSILLICTIVFIIGLIQNFSVKPFADMTLKMLVNTVALAVSAIPEGLPAITTIVIAIGMHRILQDNIIVKDASAAELLGKTDIICCDKTGVFTRNKMQLIKIFDGNNLTDITEFGADESLGTIIKIATACSTLTNDSTEDAIKQACLTYCSMSMQDIDAHFPHITEVPFDSQRKTMTVITMINEQPIAIVKGAPETVVPNCNNCDVKNVLKVNEEMAQDALRNVCIAMKQLDSIPTNPTAEEVECDLTFVGLLGLKDPPRDGVIEEINTCKKAGIRTIMVTGDNLTTAKSIAERIGILTDGYFAITGEELNNMSDDELAENIEKYSVFARISPNDKLRIVKAWQKNGKIITITGDSVQDADALALADVGCAIGKFGTDVAKGNADIIISNNRFNSVVHAIKESRGLFSNIKKSVFYLLSCNFAEILAFLFGMLIFKSAPLAAVQLLWINLLTDCAPALSLSMESAEPDIMKAKPLSTIGRIFSLKSILSVAIQSIFIAFTTLLAFNLGNDFGDTATAMTMAFATLGITQIFHCINNKFEGTIFTKKFISNRFMLLSVIVTLFVMLCLITTPAGALFGLTVLSFGQIMTCIGLSLLVIPFVELLKFIFNRI